MIVTRPAFNRCVVSDWEWAFIGFSRIGNEDIHIFLVRWHNYKGHIIVVSERPVSADAGDDVSGIRMNRPVGDDEIPRIVRRINFQCTENLIGFRGVEQDRRVNLRHLRSSNTSEACWIAGGRMRWRSGDICRSGRHFGSHNQVHQLIADFAFHTIDTARSEEVTGGLRHR